MDLKGLADCLSKLSWVSSRAGRARTRCCVIVAIGMLAVFLGEDERVYHFTSVKF